MILAPTDARHSISVDVELPEIVPVERGGIGEHSTANTDALWNNRHRELRLQRSAEVGLTAKEAAVMSCPVQIAMDRYRHI